VILLYASVQRAVLRDGGCNSSEILFNFAAAVARPGGSETRHLAKPPGVACKFRLTTCRLQEKLLRTESVWGKMSVSIIWQFCETFGWQCTGKFRNRNKYL